MKRPRKMNFKNVFVYYEIYELSDLFIKYVGFIWHKRIVFVVKIAKININDVINDDSTPGPLKTAGFT